MLSEAAWKSTIFDVALCMAAIVHTLTATEASYILSEC